MTTRRMFTAAIDGSAGYAPTPVEPAGPDTANLVGSLLEGSELKDPEGRHSPVLDIDFAARLVPSTTPGHFHLYLDGIEALQPQARTLTTEQPAGPSDQRSYPPARLAQGYEPRGRIPCVRTGRPFRSHDRARGLRTAGRTRGKDRVQEGPDSHHGQRTDHPAEGPAGCSARTEGPAGCSARTEEHRMPTQKPATERTPAEQEAYAARIDRHVEMLRYGGYARLDARLDARTDTYNDGLAR